MLKGLGAKLVSKSGRNSRTTLVFKESVGNEAAHRAFAPGVVARGWRLSKKGKKQKEFSVPSPKKNQPGPDGLRLVWATQWADFAVITDQL